MSFPSPGHATYYDPTPPGVLELNLGDEWRARWTSSESLPAANPADYAFAVVCMDGKGYVTREGEAATWGTVEGSVAPGEKPLAAIKRAAREQAGVQSGQFRLVGFLECRATSHHPAHPPGTVRLRPVYLAVAEKLKDLGPGSRYQRRRLPLNEYMAALRNRYPELEDYLGEALQAYALLRARGEA